MLKTLLLMLITALLIAGGFIAILCGVCTSDFDPYSEHRKKSERDIDNDLG